MLTPDEKILRLLLMQTKEAIKVYLSIPGVVGKFLPPKLQATRNTCSKV